MRTRRALLRAILGGGVLACAPGVQAGAWTQAAAVLQGTLGTRRIQMRLAPDPEAPESLVGSYFVFGEGKTIQVAGEYEGSELSMEESHDGTEVSGVWIGRVDENGISGTWRDGDGGNPQPFSLRRAG